MTKSQTSTNATERLEPRRKRHHYLPISYMAAWADEDRRVAARKRGLSDSFITSMRNVALEGNLYTVEVDGEPDDSFEKVLAEEVDGQLAELLDSIRKRRPPRRGTQERLRIARAIAIQHARTPAVLGRVLFPARAVEAIGHYPVTREDIERLLSTSLGTTPTPAEAQGAMDYVNFSLREGTPTNEEALAIAMRHVELLTPELQKRAWRVEISHGQRFITADRPVATWQPRRQLFQGTGFEGAYEVRFPLGPHHLLVLGRIDGSDERYVVDGERVNRVNEYLVAACNELIVSSPEDRPLLDSLPMKSRGPALRFNTAPLHTRGHDGATIPTGNDAIHIYIEDV